MTRDTPAGAPFANANFVVDLGDCDPHAPEAGFCEVVFPPFPVDASAGSRRLILRRGVTGSLDLYRWWDEARRDQGARARTIDIRLMTPDLSRPLTTWRFHGARPVALS